MVSARAWRPVMAVPSLTVVAKKAGNAWRYNPVSDMSPGVGPQDRGRTRRPMPVRFTLSTSRHITRGRDFQECFRQNNKQVGHYMILWLREADDASQRLGVVASKKVGTAVARNRAKRRIRELFRLNQHQLHGSRDLLFVARRSILEADWDQLQHEFKHLCRRAGVLKEAI